MKLPELVEDLEFLLTHGVGLDEAARRCGTNPTALERRLYRHGHADLFKALWRNDHKEAA